MYQVKKRNGKTTEFNIAKIANAIEHAFDACEKQYNKDVLDLLALKVTSVHPAIVVACRALHHITIQQRPQKRHLQDMVVS